VAVAAVTRAPMSEVLNAMTENARRDGRSINDFSKTRFRDQVGAVEALGYLLFNRNEKRLRASQIGRRGRGWTAQWLSTRPTIAEFLQGNRCPDVLLAQAMLPTNPDDSEGHTFAVDRDCWVDSSPGRKPAQITDVHQELADFRVIEQYIVRPKP
jgi:hypothetical protein